MLDFLRRDPVKNLERLHARKLEEALAAQRAGKLPTFARLTAEAEELERKIDEARR